MIAKIVKGASFRGCVQYVTGKDEAKILASDGVLLGSVGNIADSFEYQRGLNPRCSKPVGHIALSFKPEDKDKLTDGMMTKIALEYMELMGIKDTQFLLVRHHNTANPHCHLVYNRVDNNGKTISDKMERRRSEKIVKHLKDKYGLTYSDGKGQTRTERLHYTERTKSEIKNAVKNALQVSRTWQQFKDRLKQQGVEVEFKRRRGNDEVIDGVTFIKDGVRFKGSQVHRLGSSLLTPNSMKDCYGMSRGRPLIMGRQGRMRTSDKSLIWSNIAIVNRRSVSHRWVCSTPIIPFMTQPRKSSADGCNGRKRNVGQGYKRVCKQECITIKNRQENERRSD